MILGGIDVFNILYFWWMWDYDGWIEMFRIMLFFMRDDCLFIFSYFIVSN